MSDPNGALVTAIITALNTALDPVKVYTRAPASAEMPYVTLDTMLATPDDQLSSLKDRTFIYLTVWSRYRGTKQANELVATIYAALHRARLTMNTGTMIRSYVTARGVEPDIDKEIFKGRVTIRCHIKH